MFFKSLINTLSYTYGALKNNDFNNVNPNLVKYFKNEYGINWEVALQQHIYEKKIKNDKKAA